MQVATIDDYDAFILTNTITCKIAKLLAHASKIDIAYTERLSAFFESIKTKYEGNFYFKKQLAILDDKLSKLLTVDGD